MTKVYIQKFTAAQHSYIEILADPTERRTQEEVAKEFDVTRTALYKWRKLEGFWEEVERLVRDRTQQRMPRVWNALLDKCEEGNVPAMKLLFQLRGELIGDKSEQKYDFEDMEERAEEAKKRILEKLDRAEKNIRARESRNGLQ